MAKKETYGGADALSMFFPEGSAADPEETKAQETEKAPAEQPAAGLSGYESDGRERRTQRVNLCLQPTLAKLLKKQAKAEKISVNELAIKAFVQYLEKVKQ